jgi:signal transduction histidine kinase
MQNRFAYFIIGYMALAFSWWAFHLWWQNDLLLQTQNQVLYLEGAESGDPRRTLYHNKWQSRRRMIVAEGSFFIFCLAIGLYRIHRSVRREVSLTTQRRNFMLSITHELKSPIAGMRLIFETLQKRTLTPPQTAVLAQNGLRDAERLQYLVEDLLLAARLEDNWRPYPEAVYLPDLAQGVADAIRIRFPTAQIHIHPSSDMPSLWADRQGLTSILQNLLENAIKYSPEGAPVDLRLFTEGEYNILEVTDQGKGIQESEKEAIFHKFYRIGNEETRSATGTGLGLYIVQQVVKAHRGTIALRDNTPRGSIFTIRLPVKNAPAQKPAKIGQG